MRRRRRFACVCVPAALLLGVVCSCRDSATVTVWVGGVPSAESGPADSQPSEPAKDEPRSSDGASEKAETSDSPADKPADPEPPAENPPAENPLGGCGMCHIDVEDEVVPTLHYKEKVACVQCHGRSIAHAADENNEVPPDQLFTRENVDRFCETCHDPCDRAKPAERPKVRPVCTDCHGSHDLALISAEGK